MGVQTRFLACGAWSFLLLAPPLFSTPLRLEDAEKLVVEKNLDMLIRQLDVAQARSDVQIARTLPNPSLGVNVDPVPSSNRSWGVNIGMPVDLSGRRQYRIQTATQIQRAMELQLKDALRQALRDLHFAYFDRLEAFEAVRLAALNLETYQRLVDLNRNRLKNQQISKTEYTRSMVAYEQALLQKGETEIQLRQAIENLQKILGSPEAIEIDERLDPVAGPAPGSLQERLEQALSQRPDLQALAAQQRSLEANANLQEAYKYPDVTMGLEGHYQPPSTDYTVVNNIPLSQTSPQSSYGFFMQFSLPVFDRNQGNREKARLQQEQMVQLIQKQKLSIQAEVRLAYAEFRKRKEALEHYQSTEDQEGGGILEKSAAIKRAAEIAYRSGQISLLEYLDAVKTYADTYRSYVGAVSSYNKSISALNAACGANIRVEFDNGGQNR